MAQDAVLDRDSENPGIVSKGDLLEVFRIRYGDLSGVGWGPRMRLRFNYFTPDEYYEAIVNQFVRQGSAWLDVGCGRDVFPNNANLGRLLADRCDLLVGVDPDETLEENTVVHQRIRDRIERFNSDRRFDLVTLRMVAEHVAEPESVLSSLARLTHAGAKVIVYTVNRRSPVSIISWHTPFGLHNAVKRLFWDSEEKDTFPVFYRMNTRSELASLFERWGFRERYFNYLDDCRALSGFRTGLFFELCSWRLLNRLALSYPENCLLGVYERL